MIFFLKELILFVSILTSILDLLFGQSEERGDPNFRRISNIDVNRVRASIHNWGSSGNSGVAGSFFYEWPHEQWQRIHCLPSFVCRCHGHNGWWRTKTSCDRDSSERPRRELHDVGTGPWLSEPQFDQNSHQR